MIVLIAPTLLRRARSAYVRSARPDASQCLEKDLRARVVCLSIASVTMAGDGGKDGIAKRLGVRSGGGAEGDLLAALLASDSSLHIENEKRSVSQKESFNMGDIWTRLAP